VVVVTKMQTNYRKWNPYICTVIGEKICYTVNEQETYTCSVSAQKHLWVQKPKVASSNPAGRTICFSITYNEFQFSKNPLNKPFFNDFLTISRK